MSTAAALALLFLAQPAGESAIAVFPDDPTTWTLDYPVRIEPYVMDYYNCLRGGSYSIGDDRTFESQYQKDLPRCSDRGTALESEANAALAASGGSDATPPQEVALIFERARRIHLARGRSLDLAVRTRLANAAGNAESQGCRDGLQTLIDQRAAYMEAEELRIEALVGKHRYTEEEQGILNRYRAQLQRFNNLISDHRDSCRAAPAPSAAQSE